MKDERENQEPLDLGCRTKAFALRIIKLFCGLPKATEAQVIGRQVLSSGTSVGAHYREARRAKSEADFINRMQGGLHPSSFFLLCGMLHSLNCGRVDGSERDSGFARADR